MDKGMLTDATSTDDSPTPGYMLNEIARELIALLREGRASD